MGKRHATRQLAVQALFALDANPNTGPDGAVSSVWGEEGRPKGSRERLTALVAGTWERRAEIDEALESISRNWKLARMDRVDRSILRLGAYELIAQTDVPAPVAISEAVELAKEFGTPDSPSFVNGLLDKLARTFRADEVRPEPERPSEEKAKEEPQKERPEKEG